MGNKTRIEYLDQARGILISLVVLGHVLPSGWWKNCICVFHVPAFFILSGILCRYSSFLNKPMSEAILKKVHALLVPYAFLDGVYIVWSVVFGGGTLPQMVENTVSFNSNVGSLWFLHTLFFSELLFYIVQKVFRQEFLKILIPTMLGLAVFLFDRANWQIFIGRILIGLFYITIGFYLASLFQREKQTKHKLAGIVPGAFLVFAIGRYNITVDLWSLNIGNPAVYICGSLVGTFVIVEVCKIFQSRKLAFLGKNTLIILGTHKILIEIFLHFTRLDSFSEISGIAAFTFIMLAEIPIIWICNRFAPGLIGKGPANLKMRNSNEIGNRYLDHLQ